MFFWMCFTLTCSNLYIMFFWMCFTWKVQFELHYMIWYCGSRASQIKEMWAKG
ncbi:hypothetical protein HanHA300_Chr07g0247121 [Helianthus annuus]|nr:hypothetical protein HanHA300_Chr07g0247121 [Helianthus annuus]KAJ0557366.1 hypothetical protein HanIR_Chr07g0324361 [Helianthus annuus]KAJ0563555.1 hypothetical protein HanHA89_Chr07g0264481 [Helianthus annuus]KAJ0728885.1 hypothetical protein HanLR1_Chr07g0246761 [Helianthus annuus]